jgi:hypothetical protein
MVAAELMGGHTHTTLVGIQVHVWRRGNRYLARGRYQGQSFGATLGGDPLAATAKLRQLLTCIENGSFVRPSEARRRPLSSGHVPRLSLRQLVAAFLTQKRASRGRQTAGDYAARLTPVLDFAERSASRQRWPLAMDIDSEFVRSLRVFLFAYRTTRNGRPGAKPRPLSARQIVNVLECLRTLLHWAKNAHNRKLPADWLMPLTPELVGQAPAKDPLREDQLPLATRVEIVGRMDRWQLCQLGLSLVLPLRPDEATGLLIGDVNWARGWLEFGQRLPECNFTKGKTAFVLPFPDALRPVLRGCVDGRAEGPLLRSRSASEGRRRVEHVADTAELEQRYRAGLLRQPGGAIQAAQDRKQFFRCLLRRLGGVAVDAMNKEFQKLLAACAIRKGATLYTLRSSVATAMHRANLPHLEMRYLTGHTTSDILNAYTSLDPIGAMARYFESVRPLLEAIQSRAASLGLCAS